MKATNMVLDLRTLKPARSKYRNVKTVVDGLKFDSKAEAVRYSELQFLVEAKVIKALELQVRFPLNIGGVKVCTYVADFKYVRHGAVIVEDVKGMKTAVYNLKKKLMKAIYGIEIQEIKK